MARDVQITEYMKKALLILLIMTLVLTGCAGTVPVSFESNMANSNYNFMVAESGDAAVADAFASGLAVMDGDVSPEAAGEIGDVTAIGLFDVRGGNVICSKSAFTKLYPASLTKVMTALVALKYSSPDTILTATSSVNITEAGAQLCGLKEGDTMTLDQALHIMLIYSANDAAVLIAEGVGGSVEGFIDMMNREAKAIGATNTNFINSNGLSDENHYTTLYDMYLIFNAAIQYNEFNEIISMPEYSTIYHSADGSERSLKVSTTNLFLNGRYNAPGSVTVIGGKTGTTNAAGHCLVFLSRDISGNPYISIVMKALDQQTLYAVMSGVLGLIPQS